VKPAGAPTAGPALQARRRALLALASACAGPGSAWADLPGVIAAAKPSVVPVGTYSATDSPRFGFRGSGFVVADGTLVATNFHVLPEGAEAAGGPAMAVLAPPQPSDAQMRRARVVATDRLHDLALLRIEGPALPALGLADAGVAREGQAVALLGFPLGGALGFAAVTHRGIIASITRVALPAATASQLDPRALNKLREGNFEVFQLDATAYPGNSGGPLLDAETGRVLAIVNMVFVKGSRESALSNPTGISYAIPVTHLQELLRGR
jgi:S1-C subfamily serine protease